MSNHSLPKGLPWGTLGRYIAGELPDSEAEELRRWIAAEPEREALVAQLRQVWIEAGELRQRWDVEAALRTIKREPSGPARVVRLPRFYREAPVSRWQRAGRWAARAAAVAVVVGGSAWVATRGLPHAPDGPPPMSEVATQRGQRASLRLLDGTQVALGPASTIRYAVAADRGPRTVYLEGQAYFVVAHDGERPFSVHTVHGTATDLGTRFVVQAYPADSTVDVVVADGKVSLSAQRDTSASTSRADSLVLLPGDRGRVTASHRLVAQHGVAVDQYLSWIDGRLEFHDTPLRDVVVRLGRWYDLDVQLADSTIGRRRLTASFKDASLAEVLRLITASLDLRASQHGRVVTLRSNRND